MRNRRRAVTTLAACLVLTTSACKKDEAPPPPKATPPAAAAPAPFKVVSTNLGTQLTADKKVATPTDKFAPTDTIYVSVVTDGASPSVALKARWTYEDGQLVNESAQTIAPTGPSATEFHIAKPSGWPTGKYKVEISANGAPVTVKEFAVN
jgi:hypothetical protein